MEPLDQGNSAATAFRVRKALLALRRLWWIPLLTLILGGGAGTAYVWFIPPTYVSRAQMWEAVKVRLPEGSLFSEDAQTFLGTQSDLLKSPTVRALALERLSASGTNITIPKDKDGNPLPVSLRLTQSPKSSVFILQASSADPEYTRAYLNAVMGAYLDKKRDIRKTVSGDTLASISEQVQRAERDLKFAQDVYNAYQRTNNLAILQEEGTVAGNYLARLRTQLADLELEAQLLNIAAFGTNNTLASATNAAGPSMLWASTSLSSGANPGNLMPPEVQSAIRELASLKSTEQRLSRYLRPKHPKIAKVRSDIERVEGLLDIYRRQNFEQLMAARQAIDMKIESVKSSIQEWQGKVIQANSRIAEAEQLRIEVQRAQSVRDRLLLIVQNVGISRNIDQDSLAILEPASHAFRSYQNEMSALAGSLAAGLGLGLGLVALVAFRDDRFESHTELNQALGGGVVGQVPEIPTPRGQPMLPMLAMDDTRYMFAESYRSLRSALLYQSVNGPRPRTLLVTSAIPGEGKSTVAVNLARALAFGGSSVVLVDGDLRKGRIHEILGGEKGPGLADLLENPASLEAALQHNSLPNLTFIARGSCAENPGDRLLNPNFDHLLERLRERFQFVLIDTSPVFAADDTCSIAPKVDGALFVVRRGYSRSTVVREALDVLWQRQARVLGVVFNRANASQRSYHYYRYADYHRAG